MARKATAENWLASLTDLPTAPGVEGRVVDWVEKWVRRRPDLTFARDSGGNVIITQKGRKFRAPVLAVAHMDHPAFVIVDPEGSFEFRGSVDAAYFRDAAIEVISRPGPQGRVMSYDHSTQQGTARFEGEVSPGDLASWRFGTASPPTGLFAARACDDLAGAAAALAAIDRARQTPGLRHFGVLLTRAEEVGLIGALHAARHETFPDGSRLLSIETSRELPTARIGDGPIIRVGDRATIFDRDMTNLIGRAADEAGVKHQRKLMDGGGCEATAFGVYGYPATGLCLALRNWHNRGNLEAVEGGDVDAAIAMPEEISLEDFHGLVDLLLLAAEAVDGADSLRPRLDRLYESSRHYLGL